MKDQRQPGRETDRSVPLGISLPPQDEHATGSGSDSVSLVRLSYKLPGVSMPLWSDVVAYEEGDEETHAKLSGCLCLIPCASQFIWLLALNLHH